MRALVKEFRAFLMRGNLVDMAVGIVIGIAFAALVSALVKDLITPIIAALAGKHDFSALSFTIHGSRFLYGDFINAVSRVRVDRGGSVLLRREAGQRADGADADGAGGGRDRPCVPRVPQPDSAGGAAVRVLHDAGGAGLGAAFAQLVARPRRAR